MAQSAFIERYFTPPQTLVSGWWVFAIVLVSLALVFGCMVLNAPLVALWLPVALLVLSLGIPGWAVLSRDQLVVRWLLFRWVVRADDVVEVVPKHTVIRSSRARARFVGATFVMRDGRRVTVMLGRGDPDPAFEGVGDVRASNAANVLKRNRTARFDRERLLRSGLPTSDWLAVLRTLARAGVEEPSGSAGYREVSAARSPMTDALLGIAVDRAASKVERAAAAVAIAPGLGRDDSARLHACAAEEQDAALRLVLERVATRAPDEELAMVLDRIDAT